MTASLIICNGVILPAPGEATGCPPATAVAVRAGRICRVGSDADVLALRAPDTEVIDAVGGLVMPGFDDAHSHVLAGGTWMHRLSLREAVTVEQALTLIGDYAGRHPDLEWIIGGGWNYQMFPGGLPTAELLDRVMPDRPAAMVATDGHSLWVNSAALRLAGIDRNTPDPANGTIQRDPHSGEPTGALLERANALVHRVLPTRTVEDYLPELRAAIAALHASGFTAAQDPRTDYEEVPAWTALRDAGELMLRSRLALMMQPDQTLAEWCETLDEHAALVAQFRDPLWLDGGIVKAFVDGVVETGTAAMLTPYGHEHGHGLGKAAFSPDQLNAFVAEADRRGWQLQMHAIGDRAVRMSLDAVAHAIDENGPWNRNLLRCQSFTDRRHRIEHLEVTAPDDVPRFAQLGVIASAQPLHASIDPGRLAAWLELLGPERTSWAWPTAQIAAHGATIALGSDWPVVDFDPFRTLEAAVNGSNAVGEPWASRAGSNALSLPQALSAYTHGAAVAAYAEDRRGSVQVAKDADLAVLDRDLLAEGNSAIRGTTVAATVVGGVVVHRTAR